MIITDTMKLFKEKDLNPRNSNIKDQTAKISTKEAEEELRREIRKTKSTVLEKPSSRIVSRQVQSDCSNPTEPCVPF
jgi:hypothetical protein